MAGSQRTKSTAPRSGPDENDPQFAVLMEAFRIYKERSAQYPGDDPYGNGGFRAQLVEMQKKLDRLWIHFNGEFDPGDESWRELVSVIENNANDLINYAAFFLRLFRDGDRDGSWPWPN
jgi:hypothetical protein